LRIGSVFASPLPVPAAAAPPNVSEITLIARELEGARELWAKNLMPISKMTALEREATRARA
jgi:HlyD family secretion protein